MTATAPAPRPLVPTPPPLRLDRAHDLLALLPHRLGFRLHDCVVLVALRGPRREVGVVARLDLPAVLGPAGPEAVACAAGHLLADGATEVVAVVHVDEDDPRDPARGLHPAPDAAATRAAEVVRAACGSLAPVEVWVVARGRYLGLDCRDAGCCPHGGRPLTWLAGAGPLAGRARRSGPVLRSRELVGVIPPADATPRRSAAAARSRWVDARLRCTGRPEQVRWRTRSLDTWRAALATLVAGDADVAPSALGRIEGALDDRLVRDAVLLTLVEPGTDLPDVLVRQVGSTSTWTDPEDPDALDDAGHADDHPADRPGSVQDRVGAALRGLVDPADAREPDADVVEPGRARLELVVAHGRTGRQAPALTVLALLAWWDGDAVRAGVLVERALSHDPGHRLAELLDRALAAGLPPAWARRRC